MSVLDADIEQIDVGRMYDCKLYWNDDKCTPGFFDTVKSSVKKLKQMPVEQLDSAMSVLNAVKSCLSESDIMFNVIYYITDRGLNVNIVIKKRMNQCVIKLRPAI